MQMFEYLLPQFIQGIETQ